MNQPMAGTTPAPGPSYSITMRVHATAATSLLPELTQAVSTTGAVVVAVDLVDVDPNGATLDVSFQARDATHVEVVRHKLERNGYRVRHVSDRTFLCHLGGVIEVVPKLPVRTRDDLSLIYTPGVSRIATAIAQDPPSVWNLTIKKNTVAIVTDGSAVLGLGKLGPQAALPVMEGKAALFSTFGGIDAFPLCLDVASPDEFVAAVQAIAPSFGGINMEDVAAPGCFEIESRLQEVLPIPVFHDDQHGTAIVVLAGLLNACRITGRTLSQLRVVVVGVGAAGRAICHALLDAGVLDLVPVDVDGPLRRNAETPAHHVDLAARTNPRDVASLEGAMHGADVFIGVARRGSIAPQLFTKMAHRPIIFALSNPEPEARPEEVPIGALLATGRSDLPNQVNNALCFPGLFRGALDARAARITPAMKRAAAHALACTVSEEERALGLLIPSLFNAEAHRRVADAVYTAAVTGRALSTSTISSQINGPPQDASTSQASGSQNLLEYAPTRRHRSESSSAETQAR